ncbi:hypothetical protein MXB_4188 [Myxobolus squamalis]|nr:hypothetical protein MXB_4188 [Myxobolus squamalis]
MDNGDDLCEISSSHEAAMRKLIRMLTTFTTDNTGSSESNISISIIVCLVIFVLTFYRYYSSRLQYYFLYSRHVAPVKGNDNNGPHEPRDPPATIL